MRRALLDVNVLLALLDSDHVDHDRARAWTSQSTAAGWASCAVTQNGFVRILSQPRYPSPVPVLQACSLLRQACRSSRHEFWPSDVSVLDEHVVDASRVHGSRQVTDTYLLALAVAHDGCLATFDRSISLASVLGATEEHLTVV